MSQVPGFEYDIFISYRHNDNRSGWVTDFVEALKEELAATIKEPLRIYFDKNPEDGLLETHHVDKSLEGKLKCLIFIPILSQTYCDPKSFAWNHEFCAFNKLSAIDQFGRDIKLSSGNVASRIFPIRIHDLDADDQSVIERETGSVLRTIEFIYREPGVNRPLKPGDSKSENQNKTDYRNQINKIANAVKELLHALEFPATHTVNKPRTENQLVPSKNRRMLMVSSLGALVLALSVFIAYYVGGFREQTEAPQRSIAVLPFDNMNKDPEQDYFSSGMTEDILNHLSKINDLEVKSRTSVLQYKGTTKTVSEIGEELGVSNIVEGSVRKVGDKVRIVVQLIDAKRDIHLWSETYDRDLEDVLNLQSEIAIQIATTLEAKLSSTERKKILKEETQDVTAYDYYLRAREELNTINYSKAELNRLKDLVDKAISKDPNFAKAYALRSEIWFNLNTYGLPERVWVDSSKSNAQKAIALAPESAGGYKSLARVQRFLGELSNYEENIVTAYRLEPNEVETKQMYGWYLLNKNDEKGADLILQSINEGYTSKQPEYFAGLFDAYFTANDYQSALKLLDRFNELNKNSEGGHVAANVTYRRLKEYDKALKETDIAIRINPSSVAYDNAAWTAYLMQDYKKAAEFWSTYKKIESEFDDHEQTIPFRHRLGMTYMKMGREKEAGELISEQLKIQEEMIAKTRGTGAWFGRASLYYDVAVCHALMGEKQDQVIANLDSALKYGLFYDDLYKNDPAFANIKKTPGFIRIQAAVDKYLVFRRNAFSKAIAKAQASQDLKNLLDR
jgi:TolB-like protein